MSLREAAQKFGRFVGTSREAGKKRDWTCLGCGTVNSHSNEGLHRKKKFCNAECAAKYWGFKPEPEEA